MRTIIVCALLAVASAQLFGTGKLHADTHAGYTFEFHSKHSILLIRNTHRCYVISADKATVGAYKNKSTRTALEDDILQHIKDPVNLHHKQPMQLITQFHDGIALAECFIRRSYAVDYKFPASLGNMGSTQMPSQTTDMP